MKFRVLLLTVATLLSNTEDSVSQAMDSFAEIEARFLPFEDELHEFASNYGVLVEKYYHDSALWSFCFSHPKGGQAKLDLAVTESNEISLASVWWQDSYAELTRYLRWGERVTSIRASDLTTTLAKELHEVLEWEVGTWTQEIDGSGLWGKYTEREFYSMKPDWPVISSEPPP